MTVATFDLPVRILLFALALVVAWRFRRAARALPGPSGWAVTVGVVALGASLIVQGVADAQSSRGARPYPTESMKILCLELVFATICSWYAYAEDSRFARYTTGCVWVLSTVVFVVALRAAIAVPAGVPLWDFADDAALRFYGPVLVEFPLVSVISTALAFRASRRAAGPLRAALTVAWVSQAMLALGGAATLVDALRKRQLETASLGMSIEKIWFAAATLLFVTSFALVALAHRAKHLRSIRRVRTDGALLRALLTDLETAAPHLTLPQTGRTPTGLRPHAVLLRRRIEIWDRLVSMSPCLATVIPAADRDDPEKVAKGIADLYDRGELRLDTHAQPATPILTAPQGKSDSLIELARIYERLRRREVTHVYTGIRPDRTHPEPRSVRPNPS